jgi:hypothetical protein
MVNYEDAVKKPFTDLTKLFVGVILSAVPIINWISQGFVLECSGVGKNRPSGKMPSWKGFEDLFVKGFLSYVIMFVYAIPAIVVFTATVGYTAAYLFPTFSGMIPEGVSTVSISQVSSQGVSQIFSQNWMQLLPTIAGMSILLIPMIMLGVLLLLAAVYLSPIGILNYLKNRKFGKAFDLGLVTSKALTGKYLLSWLIAAIVAMILKSVLTVWLGPWVGAAATFFISGTIAFSLFGQVLREK